MKLEDRKTYLTHYTAYRCELTKELDRLIGWTEFKTISHTYHYIVENYCCNEERTLLIRVKSMTVGAIRIDNNNVITWIGIDDNRLFKKYPKNANEIMKKYVGEVIEY